MAEPLAAGERKALPAEADAVVTVIKDPSGSAKSRLANQKSSSKKSTPAGGGIPTQSKGQEKRENEHVVDETDAAAVEGTDDSLLESPVDGARATV